MANAEHVAQLKQSVTRWNGWRLANIGITPDLSGADLMWTDLTWADLSSADLRDANLTRANLCEANLREANLRRANLCEANLREANLCEANLCEANLREAALTWAVIGATNFADVDLSQVVGLAEVRHRSPSTIGTDTLIRSQGKIPEAFLRGCGVPDTLIEYLPSLIGAMQPIQFYSCFISYSSKDEAFARRLHERMRAEHLRVWFAPEDLKGGEKLYKQVEQAIQFHDRLLLVLSEHSIQSEWVLTEIRRARKQEVKEQCRKLFPIRLSSYEALQEWSCFDTDTRKDLAVEVREYFIPDFSTWKDHDAFESAFTRLLAALRATETKA